MNTAILIGVFAAAMAAPTPAPRAQPDPAANVIETHGSVGLAADVLPRRDATELRPRATVDVTGRFGSIWRVRFDAQVEGLIADRGGNVNDVMLHVREGWVEAAGERADLRVGVGRVVWGRLDEIQPSDVINPLDTARFLFEGRSEARISVPIVRARWFNGERWMLEGVLVPAFRPGTFDSLDEATSPFNLQNDLILPAIVVTETVQEKPAVTWRNLSGGARLGFTAGRVDVAVAAYRGFEGFGLLQFEPTGFVGPSVVGTLVERFPRFTMVSGDFEVVLGDWEVRGEAAAFVEKHFGGGSAPGLVRGRALDVGVGVNRGSGALRVFGSVLLHRQWSAEDPLINRTDVTLVGSVERAFARERYLVRVFGAVTPSDPSGFLRGIFGWRLRDNLTLELSAAAFMGEGETAIARFKGRDFLLARLRYDW